MTDQEKMFFSRVASKMADASLDMEAACRAVLADDQAAVAKFHRLDSYDRGHVARVMAHRVFASIHTRLAAA